MHSRAGESPGAQALAAQLRVSYAKVAEYQRRGVIHFHAIIRLDGPTGLATAPPGWATLDLLTAAINQAARAVHLETPAAPGLAARTLRWGREHDIRPIATTGDLTDSKVAAYVAKYATKAAECTGTLDRRITPADQLASLPVREHTRRHIAACIRLSKLPVWKPCAWPPGHTCSASPGISPPRAAPTPPPSARSAPTAPSTSASWLSPPGSCPTSAATPRSSALTGTSPDAGNRCPRSRH